MLKPYSELSETFRIGLFAIIANTLMRFFASLMFDWDLNTSLLTLIKEVGGG